MTTLKQGDLIKDKYGDSRKVLGVCGEVVFISFSNDNNRQSSSFTEFQLKENGYTWDTPAWEPKMHDTYWYLNASGQLNGCEWDNDNFDRARRDFLGIYETKELAEAALLEIRRKLGK
jgi:hypothetical protein